MHHAPCNMHTHSNMICSGSRNQMWPCAPWVFRRQPTCKCAQMCTATTASQLTYLATWRSMLQHGPWTAMSFKTCRHGSKLDTQRIRTKAWWILKINNNQPSQPSMGSRCFLNFDPPLISDLHQFSTWTPELHSAVEMGPPSPPARPADTLGGLPCILGY